MFSEAVASLCSERPGKTVTVIEGSSARNVLVCGFILLEVITTFFLYERGCLPNTVPIGVFFSV